MNIEEKRKKLDTFCENQVSCSKCLLEYFRIGRACQFNMYSDEDIEEAYKIVFTGKDNYKTLESKDNNTYKSLTDRKIKAVDPHIIVDFINPNTNEPITVIRSRYSSWEVDKPFTFDEFKSLYLVPIK